MSKSVMISIKPKWCELIARGAKTVEIRKTRPKLETPFKCYIYETMNARFSTDIMGKQYFHGFDGRGKVIGEFFCNEISEYAHFGSVRERPRYMRKSPGGYPATEIHFASFQLSPTELEEYGNGRPLYGWHISNLVIYDKPKELRDFIRPSGGCCNEGKCTGCQFLYKGNGYNLEDDCDADFDTDEYSILKRPPQSWCYVEEIL